MQPLNLKIEIPVYEKNYPPKKKKQTQNQKNILPLSPFKYVKTSKVLKIAEGLQKVKKLPREKKHFIEKSAC